MSELPRDPPVSAPASERGASMASLTPLLDRLADKVLVGDECWEWTAYREKSGYGRLSRTGGGSPHHAHRVMYELMVKPIPEGLVLDHLCRNPGCVRPDHLEPVDHRTNILRGNGWSAIHAAKTHCCNGHEFTPENTYIRHTPHYARLCRICMKRGKR